MFEGIAPLLIACLHDSDMPPAQENKMQWQASKNPTKPGSIHAAAATPNNKAEKDIDIFSSHPTSEQPWTAVRHESYQATRNHKINKKVNGELQKSGEQPI